MSRRALNRVLAFPSRQHDDEKQPSFGPFDGTEAPPTKTYWSAALQHRVNKLYERAPNRGPIGNKIIFWNARPSFH